MGLMLFDHFQPGSNVPRPMTLPATLITSAWPRPSNGRISSGSSKLLTSTSDMAHLLPAGRRVANLSAARGQQVARPPQLLPERADLSAVRGRLRSGEQPLDQRHAPNRGIGAQ